MNNNELNSDITTKYNITSDYLSYSWGEWIEKNIERLISVFDRLHKLGEDIELFIPWDEESKNINLRNIIIKYKLQKKIHFSWNISDSEKVLIYDKACPGSKSYFSFTDEFINQEITIGSAA